jgi:hypothetical protein
MPLPVNSERALIAGTIADIQDSVEDLEMRIEALVDELKAKRERLTAWRTKLEGIDGTPTAPVTLRKRQPKGANLRAIVGCLETTVAGLSASEIRAKTGLAWSSVQRVLAQHTELFIELNGLWKLRQRVAKPTHVPREPKAVLPIENGHDEEPPDGWEPPDLESENEFEREE